MRKVILIALITIIGYSTAFPQSKNALKDAFYEAEYYILYEDYNEALGLYLNLLNNGLDNAYINHRIGECYLQIPGQKNKSIPYLEEACENITKVIKEGAFKETNAPIRTIFYLACAYQVNNELDKAIETFERFKQKLADNKIYNTDYIEKQILSCEIAKEFMNNPIDVKESNIGDRINDGFPNIRPVISSNENCMVYVSKLKFYDAIFFTKKVDNEWTTPRNITPELSSDGNIYSCFLSSYGKTLLLYKYDSYNSDIYISHRIKNERWTTPEKLNKHINSKYQETFASLSEDGKTIYFVSDRKGGFGGTDIYKSVFDEKTNDWGKAINLGIEINTSLNEETPILSKDGGKLFFSSQGHYNMGGFDIFYAQLNENGKWEKPRNLGYPINSTDDNLFFFPVGDGTNAYVSKFDQNGFGQEDIVKLEITSNDR
ncbi:MAG: PD40 domain-containing protein [Bacteroidales bacterium]|nr:PD40 domain-containing protein [Bacteroidales bacterium]